jgi:cysteine desulfurase
MSLINHAIYLDQNSGAPLHPLVVEALLSFLKQLPAPLFGNPSSQHHEGRKARKIMGDTQEAILESLGVDPLSNHPWEVTFLSSGTDANQTAIRSALEPYLNQGERVHWITSPLEHSCVYSMQEWVKSRGGEVTLVPVNSNGEVLLHEIEPLIQEGATKLISLMSSNNELGITSHIQSVLKLSKKYNIPIHTDCIASWGKSEISLKDIDPNYLCLSAHKVGGLPGTGILIHKKSQKIWSPFLGPQQGGRRGGTENLIGIYAVGVAAKTISEQIQTTQSLAQLRNRLEDWLITEVPGIQINATTAPRLSHLLHLTIPGLGKNLSLSTKCDLDGVMVSSGSACSSGSPEPSRVLMAMGMNRMDALNSLRVSLGLNTDWDACLKFAQSLKRIVEHANST